MPSKKKPTKTNGTITKEELADPATVKDGSSTTYVGGWSTFDTLESLSGLGAQVIAAHTGPDGAVATLPRTNVFLLPTRTSAAETTEDAATSAAAADALQPLSVVVVDQMNIEGISRQLCGRAHGSLKSWVVPNPAGDGSGASGRMSPNSPTLPETDEAGGIPGSLPNPYEDVIHDVRYSQTVPVGATFPARDVVVKGSCSIEGAPPKIVVPPQLPAKPDLDAVTLDDDAAAGEEGAAAAGGKAGKPGSAAKKNAKKGKPKLTPEQLEELERKKAAVEADYLRQTEEAVQQAQEEADHLMTFAHPNRWASVVFRHVTFTGPVVVRRAHVSFHDCCFASAVPDRPQLVASQYCRVSCTKCTFESPQRCGVYALPSSQVTVRKCVFSGVGQEALWAGGVAGVAPQAGGTAADINADDVNADAAALDDDAGDSDAQAGKKNAGALSGPIVLDGEVKSAVQAALRQRSAAVGIQIDSAKLHVQSCCFIGLGVGVYVRGCYSVYISNRALVPKSAQQLTPDACDVVVEGNAFHHFANTAVLLDKTARLVALRRNVVSACAYYGLDCQGGSKSVMVRSNNFTADAVVRIRDGANVALLHNNFQSIPVNDNTRDNPCLQPVY